MIWQLWRHCVHCSVERAGPLGWADSRLHDESLDPLVETRNAALDRSWEAASTNCAMMVAHDKMLEGDLKALDRTLKVIESDHPGGAAPVADADAERARDSGLWKLVTV
jgi:hypothetical protein